MREGDTVGPYIVGPLMRSDLFCTVHQGHGDGQDVVLKHVDDATYVLNEALTLNAMLDNPDPRFIPYLPSMLKFGDEVIIFEHHKGFVTLQEVLDTYPEGIDPRDMAWMYRRLLVCLGFAHRASYLHGAVLPQNVLIHPEKHGLKLVGWSHAIVISDDAVLVSPYPGMSQWYPQEPDATPALDIYMAATLAVALMGGDPADPRSHTNSMPDEMRTVLTGSLKTRPQDRIQDAWRALEYFDALLETLYGPRKFRSFSMDRVG